MSGRIFMAALKGMTWECDFERIVGIGLGEAI
jgi:hypothetical protein